MRIGDTFSTIEFVKEGIAVSPVGIFSKLEKNPASYLKPSGQKHHKLLKNQPKTRMGESPP